MISIIYILCTLVALAGQCIASDQFYYFLEFTSVVEAGAKAQADVCHQKYYRTQGQFPLYVCTDTNTGACHDDDGDDYYNPDQGPCVRSSNMWVLSDDKKTLHVDFYKEYGCEKDNFDHRDAGKALDSCRVFPDFPQCKPELNFDACAIRFNQTEAGDETCGGCKDCVCVDSSLYSLSPAVPP